MKPTIMAVMRTGFDVIAYMTGGVILQPFTPVYRTPNLREKDLMGAQVQLHGGSQDSHGVFQAWRSLVVTSSALAVCKPVLCEGGRGVRGQGRSRLTIKKLRNT